MDRPLKRATEHVTKAKFAPKSATSKDHVRYLSKLSTAVRQHFASAMDLPAFLSRAGELTIEQRKLIVQQALILLEQNYAHLPLKQAMHSVNPIQRLKLLFQALDSLPAAEQSSEAEFHWEMTDTFSSVRDLHTNYLLPAPFNEMTAFLPFLVEDHYESGQRKYIVSHVAPGFHHATFVQGVEIVYWNGTPIEKAVWNHANRYAGSNREARHARGVQTLTMRALRIAHPPDEEWVIVSYQTSAGKIAELRFDWKVNPPIPSGFTRESTETTREASLGLDLEQDIINRMRMALFAPHAVAASKKAAEKQARGAAFADLETKLPEVFRARVATTHAGTFGYLRIWTFSHWPPHDFVNEFIRLISALPQNGLIIDVRGNGGGVIMNGELILQTLTPRRIEPEPLQFINTPLNLEICRRNGPTSEWDDLSAWTTSMAQALQTGSIFSAGFPISDPAQCNAIGQRYFGPVVLITDALCYSTTDIFAAGFQDHEIGTILGTDGNTGAGGANVWEHQQLASHVLPNSVYQPLPNGAGMRVAIRRTLRVGRHSGAPLEDLGVIPDRRHFLTRNDLLNENEDLLNEAGSLLAKLPARALKVTVQSTSATQATVEVTVQGMTRLDVYVDDRPCESADLQGKSHSFNVPMYSSPNSILEIHGFDGPQFVARYRGTIQSA